VGRCRLVLLDTNVDGNTDQDRALTSQLYGGDRRVRIRQEMVLGVGGLRALEAMGIRPGVIHMNEGHSVFAVLELARSIMQQEGRPFHDAQERAAAKTVFTTHTPVDAGHDRFDPSLVEEALGPLRQELGISEKDLLGLGRVDPNSRTETFCTTVLGLKMSRSRNAVSALHGRLTRLEEIPIGHVTNGVHVDSWLAGTMARLYNRYLGENWQRRMDDPQTWAPIELIDPTEFWEQQQILKARLLDYVRRCVHQQSQAKGQAAPVRPDARTCLDPAVLTIGFARRSALYKRADLLLHDLDRLDRLVNHPHHPVQIIYAGKAHPADEQAKGLIQRIFQVTQDQRFAGRIVFLENHDIIVARHLVQGVDLWLNTPRRPLEACGTSGQKAVLNGALNLSILDGWWAEAYDGTNGFAIGQGIEHVDWQHQDELDQRCLYEALENEVVPLFYERDKVGIPQRWIARQKNSIRTLAWRFNAHRMVRDYSLRCYLPANGGLSSSFAHSAAGRV
jgi:starch phosphorylase